MASLVVIATLISHYLPESLPRHLKHFDAKYNSQKIFFEVRDEDQKKLAYINCYRFGYFVLTLLAHICFSSGITAGESHGKINDHTC